MSYWHQNNNRGKCHIGIKITTGENVILALKLKQGNMGIKIATGENVILSSK